MVEGLVGPLPAQGRRGEGLEPSPLAFGGGGLVGGAGVRGLRRALSVVGLWVPPLPVAPAEAGV